MESNQLKLRSLIYFEKVRAEQVIRGQDPCAPFEDQDEWELAEWLMMNVAATDSYLKLLIVSHISIRKISH